MPEAKAISVTRLVRRMKNLLEIELGEVWVEGEISNIRKQSSGHQYFTLKDAGGQIPAVLFRGNVSKLSFELEDGMQVLVFAEASLYEARGQVQLIVRKVEQQGQGDLQKKFEQLKAKLSAEGLFDQSHKKAIPKFPQSIGLITSGTGAALKDMLNVLERRAPWVQPVLYSVAVQGIGAEQGIANAINEWSAGSDMPEVDVLIVARGGGSIEDLWNFNEEVVARAISASRIPIISGVGHEIDFTIADFVSDLRAPTPSAAIEVAVPDGKELLRQFKAFEVVIERSVNQRIERVSFLLDRARQALLSKSPDALLRESLLRVEASSSDLEALMSSHLLRLKSQLELISQRFYRFEPNTSIDEFTEKVQDLSLRMHKSLERNMEVKQRTLDQLSGLHQALGPEKAFARGFTITQDSDGNLVRSADVLKEGDIITTRFKTGESQSKVQKTT